MIVTHKLKMNMEEGTLLQRVEVPLGDVSTRQIEMLLYARQSPWMIPEDVTVLVRYQKADGSKGEYDTLPDGSAAWSAEGNALTIALAPQVLTTAGVVSLWAEIYQEEKVLHTFVVELSVKAPYGQARGAVSQDYYYVANVLRGPVMAQAGQVLVAETVDALGRVTKVDAVDAAALVNENGDAILSLKQSLTDGQKAQARENIDAAFRAGKLVIIPERRNEVDFYGVGVEYGKMYLQKYDKETGKVTGAKDRFLTSSDVSGIVENVIAALPVYNGEAEEV